ncbi:MAG: hypothetical protein KJZ70_12405 [Bryobacterales bacterium]|nr:hypothetical protein [Bryobacterales bacterium]
MGVSKKILLSAAIGAPLAALAYARWVRPWHLQWGVRGDEAQRYLPGDELIPHPKMQSTHAISIAVTPQLVWPWLVQMGQGRGGFYSYTWLENLAGCQTRNAEELTPELQAIRVGDPVWLHPNAAPMFVKTLEPGEALVYFGGRDAFPETRDADVIRKDPTFASSWAFVLSDEGPEGTRLIVRNRTTYGPGLQHELACRLLLEPIHFVMERKLLYTVRDLVEGRKRQQFADPEEEDYEPMFV